MCWVVQESVGLSECRILGNMAFLATIVEVSQEIGMFLCKMSFIKHNEDVKIFK